LPRRSNFAIFVAKLQNNFEKSYTSSQFFILLKKKEANGAPCPFFVFSPYGRDSRFREKIKRKIAFLLYFTYFFVPLQKLLTP